MPQCGLSFSETASQRPATRPASVPDSLVMRTSGFRRFDGARAMDREGHPPPPASPGTGPRRSRVEGPGQGVILQLRGGAGLVASVTHACIAGNSADPALFCWPGGVRLAANSANEHGERAVSDLVNATGVNSGLGRQRRRRAARRTTPLIAVSAFGHSWGKLNRHRRSEPARICANGLR